MAGAAKAHYDGAVAFSQTNFTDDLKKMDIRVLVMHGDDDQIVPCAVAGPLSTELWPSATLYTHGGFVPCDALDAGPHGQDRRPSLRCSPERQLRMTIDTPELARRNATFAASGAFKGLPFPTNPALRVIGCVASQVDPSHVLGLKLGEAVIMRNIGGRVTPEARRSWALLGRLGGGQSPSGGHLAILHHTDCAVRRVASYREQLAAFFEIPVADLCSKVVEDPYASVRVDIARHRLAPDLLVSSLVYDVGTGLIEVVVPATTEQRHV
jgi:carbonic anhydrase